MANLFECEALPLSELVRRLEIERDVLAEHVHALEAERVAWTMPKSMMPNGGCFPLSEYDEYEYFGAEGRMGQHKEWPPR